MYKVLVLKVTYSNKTIMVMHAKKLSTQGRVVTCFIPRDLPHKLLGLWTTSGLIKVGSQTGSNGSLTAFGHHHHKGHQEENNAEENSHFHSNMQERVAKE